MNRIPWKSGVPFLLCSLFLSLLMLTGCGGSTHTTDKSQATPIPTATLPPTAPANTGPGQHILNAMAQQLDAAKTLHGRFSLSSSVASMNGTVETELWKNAPNQSRTAVLQSTLARVSTGSVAVTDGKQIWQYDATKKIVYIGPVTSNASTPDTQSKGIAGAAGGESQTLLNIIQNIFDHSNGTLRSSSVSIDGKNAADIHVVPQADAASSGATSFNYSGEVYIDTHSQLPLKVVLNINNLGTVTVTIPQLDLNPSLAANLFSFSAPAGTRTRPLTDLTNSQNSNTTGTLTLVQAQKQAGYHLLSIPGDRSEYTLNGVVALGTPGLQTFTLNYMKGNQAFTLAEGKALANLPSQGQVITVRGSQGTISTHGGQLTLAWTENGLGVHLTGTLTNDEALQIAQLLN